MALSARELFLIVRAQNQASNTLRRIAGDLRSMDRATELNNRKADLQLQRQRLLNNQLAARNRLEDPVRLARLRDIRGQMAIQEKKMADAERLRAQAVRRLGPYTSKGSPAVRAAADEENAMRDLQKQHTNLINKQRVLEGQLRATDMALGRNTASFRQLSAEERAFKIEKFQTATHAIGGMGRALQLTGLVAGGAMGFIADSAAKLSTQTTLAATQVANNVKQVGIEGKRNFQAILDQMQMFPASADDMVGSLYDIFSTLNVSGSQGRHVLELMNKAAVAGGLAVRDATAGTLSVLNNFKLGVADIPSALNKMFAAVRFGRMTMAEFQATLATTAPAAKQTGQSFDTLTGSMAFLSRSLGATKAGIGFARLLEVLGGQQMQEGLKKVGVTITDNNGKLLQLPKIIDILTERFPYLEKGGVRALNFFKEIGNIQGTIQARRAFVTLTKDVGGYNRLFNKTVNDTKEFDKSYRAMSRTAGVQWQIFLNNVKAFGLTLGNMVLPVLTELGQPLRRLVGWLNDLDDGTKRNIGRALVFIAAFSLIGGTILAVGASIVGFVSLLGVAGGGLGAFAAAFSTIALIAVGVAVAGKLIYDNWDTVGPILQSVTNDIRSLADWLGNLNPNIYKAAAAFIALNMAARGLVLTSVGLAGARGLGSFIAAVSIIPGMFRSAGEAMAGFQMAGSGLVAAMGGPWVVGIMAFSAALAAVLYYESTRSTANPFIEGQKRVIDSAEAATSAVNDEIDALRHLKGSFDDFSSKKLDLAQARLDVRTSRRALAEGRRQARADGRVTAAERDNLQQLQINYQRAGQSVDKASNDFVNAQSKLNKARAGANAALAGAGTQANLANLNKLLARRAELTQRIQTAEAIGAGEGPKHPTARQLTDAFRIGDLKGALKEINSEVSKVEDNQLRLSAHMRGNINGIFKSMLSGMAPTKRELSALMSETVKQRRLPTARQAREFITNFREKGGDKVIKKADDIHNHASKAARARTLHIKVIMDRKEEEKLAKLPDHIKNIPENRMAHIHVDGQQGWNNADRVRKAVDKIPKKHDTKVSVHPTSLFAIGSAMGDSLVQGLDSQSAAARAAGARLGTAASEGVRSTAKMHSPSRVFMRHGKEMAQGMAIGLDENKFRAAKAGQNLAKAALPKDGDIQKVAKKHGKLYIEGISKSMVKEAGGVKAAMDTIQQALLDKWTEIHDTVAGQFGDLFTGKILTGEAFQAKQEYGYKAKPRDLLGDLRSQVHGFRIWRNELQGLQRRGVSKGLLAELRSLGPEAGENIAAMTHMSRKQLREYNRLWGESRKQINAETKHQFSDQLQEYHKMGKQIAFGILAGLRSATPALENLMRHVAQSMFHVMRKHNKSKSPSQLYMMEGRNMMEGLRLGILQGGGGRPMPIVLQPVWQNAMAGQGMGRVDRRREGDTIVMHVHAHHDESLQATMNRAAFRLRTQRRDR